MRTKLKIAVLAQEASKTAHEELLHEAQMRGHEYEIISFPTVNIAELRCDASILRMLDSDVVYYRTGLGPECADFLIDILAEHRIPTVNLARGIHPLTTHKRYQVVRVATEGIVLPRTVVDTSGSYDAIVRILGTPFVAKADVSSQGRDVHLVRSQDDLQSIADQGTNTDYLYQAYIPHPFDYRVHIVGHRAVAAYKRVPQPGEFRTNVSRGAAMQPVEEDRKEALLVLGERIGALFGLSISAVDLMPHTETGELHFVEINSNPGWEASDTEATGVDMSALVIDHLEACARMKSEM